mmetsp:Transcript_2048/g.2298  ORF Transcript_2048/g.2298 Transcript_2048/m.2298 type:complete len:87 (-) Transcript_2048:50-310(-)
MVTTPMEEEDMVKDDSATITDRISQTTTEEGEKREFIATQTTTATILQVPPFVSTTSERRDGDSRPVIQTMDHDDKNTITMLMMRV